MDVKLSEKTLDDERVRMDEEMERWVGGVEV